MFDSFLPHERWRRSERLIVLLKILLDQSDSCNFVRLTITKEIDRLARRRSVLDATVNTTCLVKNHKLSSLYGDWTWTLPSCRSTNLATLKSDHRKILWQDDKWREEKIKYKIWNDFISWSFLLLTCLKLFILFMVFISKNFPTKTLKWHPEILSIHNNMTTWGDCIHPKSKP